MAETRPAERTFSPRVEEDLHHAEDFLTTGHAILSGAFARHAAQQALRAAAAARGKEIPQRASLEVLVREVEPPPEIAKACRELVEPAAGAPARADRLIDLGRRVAEWAVRSVEG